MDQTAHNIYMGLAGLYLIEGEHEAGLELPQDEYDVPLILQDRSFRKDGSLAYDGEAADRIGAQGNVILVNGIPWLKFEVSARNPGSFSCCVFLRLGAANRPRLEPA
jgi:FtsP/CotA-like multicopper oxidase with cupredoxin domain